MNNLESKIVSWNKTTFPNATKKAFLIKFKEELLEALDEIYTNDEEALVLELADIAILSVSYINRFHGSSLFDVINGKFMVVSAREWGAEDKHGDREKMG